MVGQVNKIWLTQVIAHLKVFVSGINLGIVLRGLYAK